MIEWIYFPKSDRPHSLCEPIVQAFSASLAGIGSAENKLDSNSVLAVVGDGLRSLGFTVETGKKYDQKIYVPVLFGHGGKVTKAFEVDAFHPGERFVLEIEAGRAIDNNQFLKDLFEACMMHDADYFCVAVRRDYRGKDDFAIVTTFLETLYASRRLSLPLKGILVIGY
nr:hypothetical protein [Nitrosomonas nitrosa]